MSILCPRHAWAFDLKSGFCDILCDYGIEIYDTPSPKTARYVWPLNRFLPLATCAPTLHQVHSVVA